MMLIMPNIIYMYTSSNVISFVCVLVECLAYCTTQMHSNFDSDSMSFDKCKYAVQIQTHAYKARDGKCPNVRNVDQENQMVKFAFLATNDSIDGKTQTTDKFSHFIDCGVQCTHRTYTHTAYANGVKQPHGDFRCSSLFSFCAPDFPKIKFHFDSLCRTNTNTIFTVLCVHFDSDSYPANEVHCFALNVFERASERMRI